MTLKQMAAKLRHAADVLDELVATDPVVRKTPSRRRAPTLTPAQEKKRRKNLQKHFAQLRKEKADAAATAH
jgi:hypothetical protein